ncbi:hypothetical protein KAV46_01170 [Candidatus Bathyarchaeota archaeon]|jgi:hypothetical protein|nr:hypothetical protein [Candidatus Bathyarchaeota archaeon]MCK4437721.1 hypothetical protein [Candidatus Bathyarchaeota archaeon]
MTPLVVALIAVIIILALIPLTKRATSTKLRTFQATVTEKRKETSIIYVGFFTPTVKHILVTDRGLQAEATKEAYMATDVGDTVTVAEYSDGAYRVDQ